MKNTDQKTIRVGKIGYINTLPFYHRLLSDVFPFIQIYESYPTKVNLAMRQGKVEIAPISSLEYLNHQADYLLLPELAIGSRDFSGSVQLLSKDKIEGLSGATIALTRESLSSAVLLRVLLKLKYKFQNKFVTIAADPQTAIDKYPAALIIGDSALLFHPREFIYRYDLSELWWNWTEKPFCFAVWAVRRQYAKENSESVTRFYYWLMSCLNKNLGDLETLIKDSLQKSFLDPDFPKIFGYLFNLHYGLDAAMQDGLLLYYRLAHHLGVSPACQGLEFFEPNRKVAV